MANNSTRPGQDPAVETGSLETRALPGVCPSLCLCQCSRLGPLCAKPPPVTVAKHNHAGAPLASRRLVGAFLFTFVRRGLRSFASRFGLSSTR